MPSLSYPDLPDWVTNPYEIWVTEDGRELAVSEIDDFHLSNIIQRLKDGIDALDSQMLFAINDKHEWQLAGRQHHLERWLDVMEAERERRLQLDFS